MKSKYFLSVVLFLFTTFLTVSLVRAQYKAVAAGEASVWVENTGKRLLSALAETDASKKFEELDYLVENHIDVDYIGKFVMGRYWRTMTEEQKTEYLSLFREYVKSVYRSFPVQFSEDLVQFEVLSSSEQENYSLVAVSVRVNIQDGGKMFIDVEFKIHKNNQKIMITDLKIAETSFLVAYRNRFAEMLKLNDGEIEWFLEDLSDKVNGSRDNIIVEIQG